MKKYAIIVAGGKGLRMGADTPKQFLPIGGKPVLMRTLERFREAEPEVQIVLVLPASQQDYWRELCQTYGFTLPHTVATGGETRFHSVLNGLKNVAPLSAPEELAPSSAPEGATDVQSPNSNTTEAPSGAVGGAGGGSSLVAVHDGVRPFVSVDVIRRCYEAAAETGAAVPVVPVVETLREIKDPRGSVTVDRSAFRIVQTPQTFRFDLLCRAYEQPYCEAFTDDASVVEALGHPIALVDGNRENIKITTPFDLRVAEELLKLTS